MKINAFDVASIENAITKLKNYKNKLNVDLNEHIKELTKQGFEYMVSIVNAESGELKSSISWKFSDGKGIIKVGAEHAVFVEFGTGIVGANSPHPEPKDWQYDINSHGTAGWWYFDEKQNRLRWTRGQRASAFVYKTAEFLKKEAMQGVEIRIG